jgi:hypothetical protein
MTITTPNGTINARLDTSISIDLVTSVPPPSSNIIDQGVGARMQNSQRNNIVATMKREAVAFLSRHNAIDVTNIEKNVRGPGNTCLT